MHSRRSQRGLAAATVVIVIILAAVAMVLGREFYGKWVDLGQRETTEGHLRRVADALVQFASLNQRLPCPSSGTSDAGTEDSSSPYSTCNSPGGVVPWSALALPRSAAIDGWGRKISYRVFAGTTGLTQTGGASMTDCNTNSGSTGSVNAAGKCPVLRQTPPAAFLANKGLSLETDAGVTGGYAFVILSHGESGAGAFVAEGSGRIPLPATVALEYRNTQSGGTYDNRARSAPAITPTEASYFDDIVVAKSISEVVGSAKLGARDWGSPAVSFSTDNVAAILGYTPDPSTNASTGQNEVDFGIFTVRSYGSSAREVSFGQGVSGTGIGSIGAGLTANTFSTINSQTDEALYFEFDAPGRYLGITLVDFGSQSGASERVRFWFFVGGSWVQITRTACRTGDVQANFTLNPGGDFTQVYVEARDTTSGGTSSQFLIGAIRSCPSDTPTCAAPGAVAANNCP